MNFWRGRRVLLTGHTGFKGAWLSKWLIASGAHVTGVALEPDTEPALFTQLGLAQQLDHRILDIRDTEGIARIVSETQPDAVLHLAAQSLVLRGYRRPLDTWTVNVIGTINLLEGLRRLEKVCAVVIVTTDKVYDNQEWEFGYRENDPLGGHDPYSASKAAAEIAISCWRRSFLSGDSGVRVASARAGNVIGGGDWSENRLVPDLIRALMAGKPIEIRNSRSTRPWQHVLEPLAGYLRLAQGLLESEDTRFQDAFNFGPEVEANRTAGELVAECLTHWPGTSIDLSPHDAPHEASRLALVIERARERLGWRPRWSFARAVEETMKWYDAAQALDSQSLGDFTLAQVRRYEVEVHAAR